MRMWATLLAVGVVILGLATDRPAEAQGGLFGKKNMGDLLDKGKSLLNQDRGGSGASGGSLSNLEIGNGLKEALHVGTQRVVGLLGKQDGFYNNKDVHIPLPGALGKVKSTLSKFGMGGMTDDLERRLNRAAETAVPKTAKLFGDAIKAMSWEDAKKIFNGPKDSATNYFRGKMSNPLKDSMRPVVDKQLAEVGAIRSYDNVMGQYRSLPFVPDAKADLTNYVLGKALNGIFLYLGREEAAIRDNPAKRSTEILKKVFGSS